MTWRNRIKCTHQYIKGAPFWTDQNDSKQSTNAANWCLNLANKRYTGKAGKLARIALELSSRAFSTGTTSDHIVAADAHELSAGVYAKNKNVKKVVIHQEFANRHGRFTVS